MRWALLLALACGGSEDLFPERGGADAGQASQAQETPLDCRPVRIVGCYDALNDRACFRISEACAALESLYE